MERPAFYKRYTAPSPSHLTINVDALNPLPSLGATPYNPYSPLHPHLHPLSPSSSSSSHTQSKPRVLREASQPDLIMSPSTPRRTKSLTISPPPHSSFLSLEKPSIQRQHSSPPLTAGLTSFSIDKTRTRKQSFVPSRTPISPRWDMLPSIQGVMATPSNAPSISSTPTSFRSLEPKERVSSVDFGKEEKRKVKKEKKESFRLPMMPPPPPPVPPRRARSGVSVHSLTISGPLSVDHVASASGITGLHTTTPISPRTEDTRQLYPPPSSSTRGLSTSSNNKASASNGSSTYTRTENNRATEETELEGWDVIASCPTYTTQAIKPPARSSSFQQHHRPYAFDPEPETNSLSDSLDLKAVEVLEHLSGHLNAGGWGDSIVAQALAEDPAIQQEKAQVKRDTGSMGSWRDIKKKREGIRPLSEQGFGRGGVKGKEKEEGAPGVPTLGKEVVTRHVSSSSGKTVESRKSGRSGEAPVVPPRRTSRVPLTPPEDGTADPGHAGQTTNGKKKELEGLEVKVPMTLTYNRGDKNSSGTSPTSSLPFHLRPLPPIPSASNTPPKGLLPARFGTRLLRPKRPSTAPVSPTVPFGASTNVTAASPPRILPKLVAREEPPAALGKRSSDIADRRKGMTAMSFLAMEDPTKLTSAHSSRSNTLSSQSRAHQPDLPLARTTTHLTHVRNTSAGARSMVSSIMARSESPVVKHIIPPSELCKIGADTHLARQDSISSFGSDWRTDVSRYGGGSSVDLGKIASKTSLGLPKPPLEDEGLPPPRRSGPVVPPRKISTQNHLVLPNGRSALSPIVGNGGYPTPLSPPPRSRYAKVSAPPVIISVQSHLTPPYGRDHIRQMDQRVQADNVGGVEKDFGLYALDQGRSAWTLPTNDRPSTMGHWSPPDTPSPTKRYFNNLAHRPHSSRRSSVKNAATLDLQSSPESGGVGMMVDPDGDFGTPVHTPTRPAQIVSAARSPRYPRGSVQIQVSSAGRRKGTDDSAEATTPKSMDWDDVDVLEGRAGSERSMEGNVGIGPKAERRSIGLVGMKVRDCLEYPSMGGNDLEEGLASKMDRYVHPFLQRSVDSPRARA